MSTSKKLTINEEPEIFNYKMVVEKNHVKDHLEGQSIASINQKHGNDEKKKLVKKNKLGSIGIYAMFAF